MNEGVFQQIKKDFYKALGKAKQAGVYRARLGYGDADKTLYVDGRSRSWVWARILGVDSGAPREVVCKKVTPLYGFWAKVEQNTDGYYEVMEYEEAAGDAASEGRSIPNVSAHNWTHSLNSADPIRVDGLQFKPLLTRPTEPAASLSVYMEPLIYLDPDGTLQEWAGGAVDLTSYVPTGANTQRIVIVGLDKSDNSSTVVAADAVVKLQGNTYYFPFTIEEIRAIALGDEVEPSAVVRLYKDQTTIQLHDIVDQRRWLSRRASTRNLAAQTADDTVSNTAAETSLIGTVSGNASVPANALAAGTSLRITANGQFGTVDGTPTLTFRIKLGGTTILDSGGVDISSGAVSNGGWAFDVLLTCRTTGASGTIVGGGLLQFGTIHETLRTASAVTINTTTALALDITAQWSDTDAANTITLQAMLFEMKNVG